MPKYLLCEHGRLYPVESSLSVAPVNSITTRIKGDPHFTIIATKIDLTPLPPFDPLTEPNSISQRWKSWKHLRDVLGRSEYNRGQAEESPITIPGWASHARNL